MKPRSVAQFPAFPATRRLLALVCLLVGLMAFAAQAKPKTRKVVFIIVDGVPADVVEQQPVPNLKAIAQVGGYTRSYVGGEKGSYSETPTISAVGYDSMLTGTWVNKHNVWDNNIKDPNYNYPTFFRLFKQTYPAKKTAIYSTWLDNRTKLVGDNLPQTGNIPVDIHYDGMELDTTNYPHDEKALYIQKIDDSVAQHAAQSIREQAPDLSWVYLEYTDSAGHHYGDSPEFIGALARADQQVGQVWQAIQYREQHFNEEWMIVVTTDHGRSPTNGKSHGGQSDRERASWIFTNAKALNAEFAAPQASAVDIMPSIARFLDVPVPQDALREVDGVPFIGQISAISPRVQYENGKIQVQWQAFEKKGTMKLWLSNTNEFKTGGKDTYRLVKEVPLSQQAATLDVGEPLPPFTKIVLEAPHNTLNHWIVAQPDSKPTK